MKKTHCKRGHERISENLFKGGACKLCDKLRYRRNDLNYVKSQIQYRNENREQLNLKAKEYRIKNKKEISRRRKESYRSNPEPQKVSAKKWAEENRERKRHTDKAWVKSHPVNHAATIAKYRANKKKTGGSFSPEEWFTLCFAYGFKCLCCGELKPLVADHVIPLSKGGSSFLFNIQPLCHSCNSHKATKTTDYRLEYKNNG